MTSRASPAQTIGEHPLTGKLVSVLRQHGHGLGFEAADIERFRREGAELDPDALATWVRDLSTLAITLRNDILATTAASQIEHGLIDPLCRVLEEHARSSTAGVARSNTVERVVSAERRKLERQPPTSPQKQQSSVGAYLRRRRTKTP